MISAILADLIVIFHFLWILFLLFGFILSRGRRWLRWLHWVALVFSFLLAVCNWYCPLTYLEFWLDQKHDPDLTYTGSFIAHYLEKIIYLNVSPKTLFFLTMLMIIINIFGYIFFHRTRKPNNNYKK